MTTKSTVSVTKQLTIYPSVDAPLAQMEVTSEEGGSHLNESPNTEPLLEQPGKEMQQNHSNGLDCLKDLDTLIVDEAEELFRAFPLLESKRKFMILDKDNKRLFYGYEEANFRDMFFYDKYRGFDMFFKDMNNKPLMKFVSTNSCGFLSCYPMEKLKHIDIEVPAGNLIGKVILTGVWIRPEIIVKNEVGNDLFKIIGPFFTGQCCVDNVFRILKCSEESEEIGQILAQWAGCSRECCSDSDFFEIRFPKSLELKYKILILAACILIDCSFYQFDSGSLMFKHIFK